jgi:hypothetical protein
MGKKIRKMIKWGALGIAALALWKGGCSCIAGRGQESEPERRHITGNTYDISEAINDSYTQNSYISTMERMGEAKGLILQYMTDETASLNLDSEVREYVIENMRDRSLDSGFDLAGYMESFSEFVREKRSATRTLDNIADAYDALRDGFQPAETEQEFRQRYIENGQRLNQFLQIGRSMIRALETVSGQYRRDSEYFEGLAETFGQRQDEAGRNLLTQITNYTNLCERMANIADYQRRRIAVEVDYIESAVQGDVVQ